MTKKGGMGEERLGKAPRVPPALPSRCQQHTDMHGTSGPHWPHACPCAASALMCIKYFLHKYLH